MQGEVHPELALTHIDISVLKKLPLDKLKNLTNIDLIGNFGDPLMHPNIDEVLDFFKKQKIMISTNASIRNELWWERLGKRNNVKVIFCIDGLEDTHHLYRRNTSYTKIMRHADRFIRAGGKAVWQFIVFKHNEHQTQEAKAIAEKMGFHKIDFIYSDRFEASDTWKVYENGKHVYDLEKSSNQTLHRELMNSEKGEKDWKNINRDKGPIECIWSQLKKMYIHSDGVVYPCCMMGTVPTRKIENLLLTKIVKDQTKMSLQHNDLEDILDSEVYKKLLPKSLQGDPFSHPTCIAFCNRSTGKLKYQHLNILNN